MKDKWSIKFLSPSKPQIFPLFVLLVFDANTSIESQIEFWLWETSKETFQSIDSPLRIDFLLNWQVLIIIFYLIVLFKYLAVRRSLSRFISMRVPWKLKVTRSQDLAAIKTHNKDSRLITSTRNQRRIARVYFFFSSLEMISAERRKIN